MGKPQASPQLAPLGVASIAAVEGTRPDDAAQWSREKSVGPVKVAGVLPPVAALHGKASLSVGVSGFSEPQTLTNAGSAGARKPSSGGSSQMRFAFPRRQTGSGGNGLGESSFVGGIAPVDQLVGPVSSGGEGDHGCEPMELTNSTQQGEAAPRGTKRKGEELESRRKPTGIAELAARVRAEIERRSRLRMAAPILHQQATAPVRQGGVPPKRRAESEPEGAPSPKRVLTNNEELGDEQLLEDNFQQCGLAIAAQDRSVFAIYRTKPMGMSVNPAHYRQRANVWLPAAVDEWLAKLPKRNKGPQDIEDQIVKFSYFRGKLYAEQNGILDEAGKTAAFESAYGELGELAQMVGAARPADVAGYPMLASIRTDGTWRTAKGQPLRAYRPLHQQQPGPSGPSVAQQSPVPVPPMLRPATPSPNGGGPSFGEMDPPRDLPTDLQSSALPVESGHGSAVRAVTPAAGGGGPSFGKMDPPRASTTVVQSSALPVHSGHESAARAATPVASGGGPSFGKMDPPRASTTVVQSSALPVQSGPSSTGALSPPLVSVPALANTPVPTASHRESDRASNCPSTPATPALPPIRDVIANFVGALHLQQSLPAYPHPPLRAGRSQEYINAVEYRAFVRAMNGRYNSVGERDVSEEHLRSEMHSRFPAIAKADFDECKRLIMMRFNEPNSSIPQWVVEILLEKQGVLELLARPYFLATVLGVEYLFLWDTDLVNFVYSATYVLEWYGYR